MIREQFPIESPYAGLDYELRPGTFCWSRIRSDVARVRRVYFYERAGIHTETARYRLATTIFLHPASADR